MDILLNEFRNKKNNIIKNTQQTKYIDNILNNNITIDTDIDKNIESKNELYTEESNKCIKNENDLEHPKLTNKLSISKQQILKEKISQIIDIDIDVFDKYKNPKEMIKDIKQPNIPLINIITRTSNRPNYFLECYHSVVRQTYPNIRHIIGYDNKESLDYIKQNETNMNNIFFVATNEKRITTSHMPYNLYQNQLMSKVKDGWIMYLDDDDMLYTIDSIEKIVSNIKHNDQLLIWKVKRMGDILPKKTFKKKPTEGDITSNGFLFHSKYISIATWDNKSASDYRVVSKLFNCSTIKTLWLNEIISKINNYDGLGRGKRKDKKIENPIRNNLLKINMEYGKFRKNLFKIKNDKSITNKDWIYSKFDEIYLLNLDRRKDRLEQMTFLLKKNDINKFYRFSAMDGKTTICQNEYLNYQTKPYNNIDKKLKRKGIPSSGSWAILLSMRNMILHAKNNNYKKILVLQDDLIFIKDFKKKFINFYEKINGLDWKLLYLGVSNHYWNCFKNSVENQNCFFYYPNGYCDGAFAVGIDNSIFDELLFEINKMSLPFDSGPLKTIQFKYKNQCIVCYPNLIIADVTNSDCRQKRSQTSISNKFGWNLSLYKFNYSNIDNKKEISKNKIDISIIITTYNSSKYVYSSIYSIIKQTFKNIEIIIVDDKSTDNTKTIIKNIKEYENRIIFVENDMNYGTYISKNIGILHSKGRYITFQDSDDYSISNRLEKQFKFMENNKEYAGCNCCFYSRSKAKQNELVAAEITLFIKRDIFQKIGFFDSVRVGADTEFRRRMQILNYKIHTINEYLYTCLDRLMECNNIGKNNSLTASTQLGVNSDIRNSYRNSFTEYHQNNNSIYMPFPQIIRLFPIKYNQPHEKQIMESQLSAIMINYLSNIDSG